MGKVEISDHNFYVVHGWMRNVLGLKGNALDIYAIIYGFSQTEHQEFTASISYLSEWLGASRPTVINTLKDLVEKGYLTKESREVNGVIYNRYRAVIPEAEGGSKKILPPVKNFDGGSKKILLNNIKDKDRKKDSSPTEKGASASPKKKTSYKEVLSDPKYQVVTEALEKFLKYCRGMNYTPKTETLRKWGEFLVSEAGNNPEKAMSIVDQSMERGWKSLYTLKSNWGGVEKNIKGERFNPEVDEVAKDENGQALVY